MIPGVPSIKAPRTSQGKPACMFTLTPARERSAFVAFLVTTIRLQVLKNGERDQSKAVHVVGPDISNVTRRITEIALNRRLPFVQLILEVKSSSALYRRLHLLEPEEDQRAGRQVKRLANARQREIKLVGSLSSTSFSFELTMLSRLVSGDLHHSVPSSLCRPSPIRHVGNGTVRSNEHQTRLVRLRDMRRELDRSRDDQSRAAASITIVLPHARCSNDVLLLCHATSDR